MMGDLDFGLEVGKTYRGAVVNNRFFNVVDVVQQPENIILICNGGEQLDGEYWDTKQQKIPLALVNQFEERKL